MTTSKSNPTERQEQTAYIKWARYQPKIKDIAFHIPNGGSRHFLEAKNLKAMGVLKGVSDIFIPYPVPQYHGLWLEMKRKGGRLTYEQESWLHKMKNLGYEALVCEGAENAIELTEYYLSI